MAKKGLRMVLSPTFGQFYHHDHPFNWSAGSFCTQGIVPHLEMEKPPCP